MVADATVKNSKLRLFKVWWKVTQLAVQSQLISVAATFLFLIGKIVRFIFYFVFLFQVLTFSKSLANYGRKEIIVFFLIFNLVDILAQALFRGVYHFRPLIVSGDYDLDLLKPLPSFFRPIFGMADIFDFITLLPLSIFLAFFFFQNQLFSGIVNILLFFVLLLNSVLIAFSFHLFVCAVCVLTTEIDHLVWVYRDLTSMARFSTDIYPKGVQAILTFVIPVVILMTVPAKVLLGYVSWQWIILSLVIGGMSLWGSLKFWRYALLKYSSASS